MLALRSQGNIRTMCKIEKKPVVMSVHRAGTETRFPNVSSRLPWRTTKQTKLMTAAVFQIVSGNCFIKERHMEGKQKI